MFYRMFTYEDDTVSSLIFANTFEEPFNEFDMNQYNFLPSFELGSTSTGSLEFLYAKQIFKDDPSGARTLNYEKLKDYMSFELVLTNKTNGNALNRKIPFK